MAKQLYIKLQTPTIELKVTAKDPSGVKDSFIVGFKREDQKGSSITLDTFSKLSDTYLRMLLGQPLEGKATEDNKGTEEYSQEEIDSSVDAISDLISANVVYIKQANLVISDSATDKDVELVIPDTRKAKPNEDLWETPDECLAALLGMYLASAPCRSSLLTAFQKALLNIDYEEDRLKN